MTKITRRRFITLAGGSLGTALLGAGFSCGPMKGAASQGRAPVDLQQRNVIEEPARLIPVMAETDVLVVGGGPGGLSAALAAAKEGVDVMLVERYGFYGGMITQAIMGSCWWYRYAKTIDAGGVSAEFEQRAEELGASLDIFAMFDGTPIEKLLEKMGYMKDGHSTYQVLDTEMFKYVADVMLLESQVVPILHCLTVDAIMDGNVIKGVVTESKSGRQAILAKRVIDASGDADIAARAGAPFRQSATDQLETATTNFGCSGVNLLAFGADMLLQNGKMKDWADEVCDNEGNMFSPYLFTPFIKAKAAGEIPENWDIRGFPDGFTDKGEVLSLDAVYEAVDPTDVWDLTRAEMQGRKESIAAVAALKKYAPGFENARLRNFGMSLGVRESRKIIGAYNLTEYDVRNEARFADSIGICPEFQDGYGILCLPTTGRYFQVPYGIILPQTVDNLLVAGRSVAGDRISHATTRQMACCMVTGQGAGAAAAVSVKNNTICRSVNIADVQNALIKQGVRIA